MRISQLHLRILSGAVLGPLVIAVIIAGGWLFLAMVTLAAVASWYEWYGMAKRLDSYRILFAGAFYLMFCFMSYVFLRFGFEAGAWLALCVMLAVWASDTGAYAVGKKIGGPKMAPKISPNKTWAGLGGAMFFCGLALMALAGTGKYFQDWMVTDMGLKPRHVWGVFFAGCALGAVGQAGDLFISFFKRRAGVKDSGNLIPGHGGLLDRIDALLLVVPAFVIMVMLWMA